MNYRNAYTAGLVILAIGMAAWGQQIRPTVNAARSDFLITNRGGSTQIVLKTDHEARIEFARRMALLQTFFRRASEVASEQQASATEIEGATTHRLTLGGVEIDVIEDWEARRKLQKLKLLWAKTEREWLTLGNG